MYLNSISNFNFHIGLFEFLDHLKQNINNFGVFSQFSGHSTLDFVVSSQHDDYELAVRIIHCPDWSHSLPKNVNKNFDVLKLVQDWHLEYQDGPLVVVDK